MSLLTLTVRHALGDDLREVRRVLTSAWRRMFQGEPGRRLRAALGIAHHVRALEVTHGPNGWHPHLHALIFHRAAPRWDALELVRERWRKIVGRMRPAATPSHERGADLRASHRSDYIAKLGLEVGSIATKAARSKGGRTPWEIAANAAAGDVDERALWVTYTESMHGARQLTWSKGARKALGLPEDDEDEEHAAEPPAMLVVNVPGEVWDHWSKVPGWTAELLRRARGSTPFLDCAEWLRRARAP